MARAVAPLTGIFKTRRPASKLTYHFAVNSATARKRPWIVISHHFGGSSTSSQRHVSALNSMGFDCVTFNFSWQGQGGIFQNCPWSLNLFQNVPVNLMSRWAEEIADVLDELDTLNELNTSPRKKIIFSFSGPAASALRCIAERSVNSVAAFICDSGPFTDPRHCTRLMIEQVYGYKEPRKREMILSLMMLMWGPGHDRKLNDSLSKIARRQSPLPILSFRGIQDTIVPIEKIREAMDASGLKHLTVADLECGHLTGLRDQPEKYKSHLSRFLETFQE